MWVDRRLAGRGTFELWEAYSEAVRHHEDLVSRPRAWLWGRRLARAAGTIGSLAGELNTRYDAVLRNMMRVRPPGQPEIDSGQAVNRYHALWLAVQDEAKTRRAASGLPALLWRGAVYAAPTGEAALLHLKPRFMLRPFVDAMASSDERGVILLLAFGRAEAVVADSLETQRQLERGCRGLHESILNRLPDVEPWTDGALSERRVLELEPPYREYLRWLFPG